MFRTIAAPAAFLIAAMLTGCTAPAPTTVAAVTVAAPSPSPSADVAPGVAMFRAIFADPATPACVYEDGSELLDDVAAEDPPRACRWDASESGNGAGVSFVVITAPLASGEGVVLIYIYADGLIEL